MEIVFALVDDLFFQAKILETARHVGVQVRTFASGAALLEAAADPNANSAPALVIVDLNSRGGALEAIQQLRASGNPAPIVAFLSHVQTELAQRARAAGCEEVMPRSKFTKELPQILSRGKN
jgi:DNA-binding NarL/FixJ family response regulator